MSLTRVWLALVLLASLLAGCGSFSATKEGVLNIIFANNPWVRAIQPLFDDFEEQTGVQVNAQVLGQDQARQRQLITLQSKSSDLDVFMTLPSNEGRSFVEAGYYEPLDNYARRAPASWDFADFMASTVEGSKIDGTMIGVPTQVEGPVVYYRKDLFKQYGVPLPKTLEDLVAAGRKIYDESDGTYVVATRGLSTASTYTFGNFLHNMGLPWTENGQPTFGDPRAAQAIDYYATLAGELGPPGAVNNTYAQISALMAQGRASIAIESSNELAAMAGDDSTVGDELGVLTIPRGAGPSDPTILSWTLAISKFSTKKDDAWKFVQWATSKDVQEKLTESGIASPRTSTYDTDTYQSTLTRPVDRDWATALRTIVRDGNPEVGPPTPDQAAARKAVGDNIAKVMLGDQSAEGAAAAIQSALSPLVSPA